MKTTTVLTTFFSVLIFSSLYVNAEDNQPNNLNLNSQQIFVKTSKGTRIYQKTDYSKISQASLLTIPNHKNSSLGHRGTRPSSDNSLETGPDLVAVNRTIKSRGTRNPNW